jgi:hypothetical protein
MSLVLSSSSKPVIGVMVLCQHGPANTTWLQDCRAIFAVSERRKTRCSTKYAQLVLRQIWLLLTIPALRLQRSKYNATFQYSVTTTEFFESSPFIRRSIVSCALRTAASVSAYVNNFLVLLHSSSRKVLTHQITVIRGQNEIPLVTPNKSTC